MSLQQVYHTFDPESTTVLTTIFMNKMKQRIKREAEINKDEEMQERKK
jgi:hypothetical protein